MSRTPPPPRSARKPEVFSLISRVQDLKKRNLLRGYISRPLRKRVEIEEVRKPGSASDMMLIGALLKGPDGLLQESKKRTCNDLYGLTRFSALDWKNEARFTAGYVNNEKTDALLLLEFMGILGSLNNLDADAALSCLENMSSVYGASNYLSYKLAYLRSTRGFSPAQLTLIREIENSINHKQSPGFHFSALENISPKISVFQISRRRVSGLVKKVHGDIRRAVSLGNFVPTPLSVADLPKFLLRATESSLADTLYAILILFNLRENFDSEILELERWLDPEICSALYFLASKDWGDDEYQLSTDRYEREGIKDDRSLSLYRLASAFLERKNLAIYRNAIDKVIGVRLLAEIFEEKHWPTLESKVSKITLLQPQDSVLDGAHSYKMDTFYRTYLFLQFIRRPGSLLTLNDADIKFIFENTLGLESLLTEVEMRQIYSTAPEESQSIIAVLALALFRKKSIDPDIDFEFRTDFIEYVNNNHQGSVLGFIQNLLQDSPAVAGYIVDSLDEVTLEKMYTLVADSSQASEIRRDILKAIGQKLNKIEYVLEASSIETRAQLSKLQEYFDSSRMYVDSLAMKKWLDVNPSVSTEQYRTLYPSIQATLAIAEYDSEGKKDYYLLTLNAQSEELVSQIAKEAFEQFCLNPEFGIESYLGRRIRHNTLDGITTESVDAVFQKPEYNMVMGSPSMKRTAEAWMTSYKAIVDKLRREHLQFKAASSLFKAVMDIDDPLTKENLRLLSSTLRGSGNQMLNDLIISFCWKQIAPQLENAARFIKTQLLQEATSSISRHFSGGYGSVEEQIKIELHNAVSATFKKVADWFQVPQTGFASATVKELCDVILLDTVKHPLVKYSGKSIDTIYTGISVHRLYDCIAVLLQNAMIHGEDSADILVDVNAQRGDASQVLELVRVTVTSTASSDRYERAKSRISSAIAATETSSVMVTEGYTGIKKVKFLTKLIENKHTVTFDTDDDTCQVKVGFSLHSEKFTDDLQKSA